MTKLKPVLGRGLASARKLQYTVRRAFRTLAIQPTQFRLEDVDRIGFQPLLRRLVRYRRDDAGFEFLGTVGVNRGVVLSTVGQNELSVGVLDDHKRLAED